MSAGITRRQLLEAGGLAAALGTVLVACGTSEAVAPGRVGYAPAITPLPTVELTDVVYLRTATSMEHLLLELYASITEMGALDDLTQALVDRLVEDHRAAADTAAQLTTEAGGEPYECANTWYAVRVVPDFLEAVRGNEAADVAPSDEPAVDLLRVSHGFESMLTAMYQRMIGLVTEPTLRAELAGLGTLAARHAAVLAMEITGTPEGYISPTVLGAELTPDETGRPVVYAIPTRFGQLNATEIIIGAANDEGTRLAFALETPADNAYVYDGETCEA